MPAFPVEAQILYQICRCDCSTIVRSAAVSPAFVRPEPVEGRSTIKLPTKSLQFLKPNSDSLDAKGVV